MEIKTISKSCTIATDDNGNTWLLSYGTKIAVKKPDGTTYLDEIYYKYSATTNKHRCMFLNETGKQTETKIKAGTYKLTKLN